jgi:GTPase SAR1 family protein
MASDTGDTSSSDELSDRGDLSFWNRRDLKFRILILGRANAGKTTILERLTGTSIDEAEVMRYGKILAGQVRRV